jgi:hypothetical protein
VSVHSVGVDRRHAFVIARSGSVSILPKQPSGESYAGCRYELELGGKLGTGTVGKTGVITQQVPASARTGELRIWPDASEEKPIVWPLELEDRPSVMTFEGVRFRLENLGFSCGDEQEEGPETRRAVREFEEWIGLKSLDEELHRTGSVTLESSMSDAFRKKLEEVYSRPAGMHHGAEFVGDDRETELDP